MDKRIEELIDFTKEKFGLDDYYLHTYSINRSTTIFKETEYSLSMEWFPNHVENWEDEDFNPEGTACIEIDIHSRKTIHVIFSEGKSVVESMTFDLSKRDEIIKWIETETGLTYGSQFQFWKKEDNELYFKECIDGVAVSPSGCIELKVDKEGRLTFFSVLGQFPADNLVKKEKYVLTLEKVEKFAKQQLKLVEFPVLEQKKYVPAYAIEELYIKNDSSSILPYEFFVHDKFSLKIDKVIEWDNQMERLKPFEVKIISLIEHVTPEQAFKREPNPDLRAITEDEIIMCVRNIQDFFRQEYANDSGKWVLMRLYRDKGYIHATLKTNEQKEGLFSRKVKLFIDSETYEVLNYMDNQSFLDMFTDLEEAGEIKVTKEEAFLKLQDSFALTPYYVYDFEKGYYSLYGKLDCQYAVNANSGEVINLDEL